VERGAVLLFGALPEKPSFTGRGRSGFEIRLRSIGHRPNDPHTKTCCESNLSSMISGLMKFMMGSVILEIKASDGQQETYLAP